MDPKIKIFLQELKEISPERYDIVNHLYLMFKSHKVSERFIYGGIGFYVKGFLIGGIYSYKEHVSLVFSEGNLLDDKYHVLEGSGETRRHIKIRTEDDIAKKHCIYYINQLLNEKTTN